MVKKQKIQSVDDAQKIAQVQAAADMYGEPVVKPPKIEAVVTQPQESSDQEVADHETPPSELAKKEGLSPTIIDQTQKNRVKNAAIVKADIAGHNVAVHKAEKQGIEEAIKEEAKQQVKDIAKMQELVDTAPRPLLEVRGVFPFQLFPDRITVEETRVNVIFKHFFATEQVRSITIQDVMEVSVTTALVFASLKIVSRTFNPTNVDPLQVNFLKVSDAQRARRLIEGLKVAIQQNVDTSKLNVDELIAKADELGKIHQGDDKKE